MSKSTFASPSEAQKVARRVSKTLRPRRQWFDVARHRFEEDVRRYKQRFGKTKKALCAARKAVEAEWKAVNAGKTKPGLTGDEPPAKGLCWHWCVVQQTLTCPLTKGGLPKMTAVGAWVSPQVYARLTNGPEPPPWRRENPSTETTAMMCALLHDLALPRSRHLLGPRDGESKQITYFREDCRLYFSEPFHDLEALFKLKDDDPLDKWNRERLREIRTHLDAIEVEVPVEDAAGTRQPAVARGSDAATGPTQGKARRRNVRAPTDRQRQIATFYENGDRNQTEVATYLTQNLPNQKKSISQTTVSRAIRATNRWRVAHPELNLPQIPTRKRKVADAVDPDVINMGARTDRHTLRQRERRKDK